MKLNKNQIIDFIENYGNDHVFLDYTIDQKGNYVVRYIPILSKLVSAETLPFALKEIHNNKEKYASAIKTIVLTKNKAYIINANKNTDMSLVENYKRFLKDQEKGLSF